MFAKGALVSFLLAAGVIGAPDASADSDKCPEVWNYVAKELKYDFIDSYGYCNNYARQSIRLPFHDCFPGGGCDGSIVLTDECFTRHENERLIPICAKLRDVANRYHVPVADLINLAGGKYNSLNHVRQENMQDADASQPSATRPANTGPTRPSTSGVRTTQRQPLRASCRRRPCRRRS